MPMKLQTVVELPKVDFLIRPEDRVMMLGSCFSDRIGERFAHAFVRVLSNPFGTLYNPASVAAVLRLTLGFMASGELPDDMFYLHRDGMWYSYMHDVKFARRDKAECREAVLRSVESVAEFLRSIDVLFVTFGTRRVYSLASRCGYVVSNCHKMPADTFVETDLGVAEIASAWIDLVGELAAVNPRIRVVFTVSPFRYIKYGLHGSALSKAALLLAIDDIVKALPGRACYFPSYEIVNDELRDYRFYEPDMLHPTRQTSDYIWERLGEWLFADDMHLYIKEGERISAALAHRNMGADAAAHLKFLLATAERIDRFKAQYPFAPTEEAAAMLSERIRMTKELLL